MDPLATILAPAPQFAENEVLQVLQQEFGLRGTLSPLVSERDQNFRLNLPDGRQFVFKIANATEPQSGTDCQVAALLHIEQQQCPVAAPRVHRTLQGDAATWIGGDLKDVQAHRCRVVSFLPGELLSSVRPGRELAANLGHSAAQLDLALQGFSHVGDSQVLLWDLQRAGALRKILQHIDDLPLRAAVQSCIDDFELRVQPNLAGLRHQVIHADLNPDNVLVSPEGRIAGVIDFGDMQRAPLVMEVAITAAYLRPDPAGDVLSWIVPFVAAYHEDLPLRGEELDLLFDLIRARLAATISILRWRASVLGAGDAYSRKNLHAEDDAAVFLAGLDKLGRSAFRDRLKKTLKVS